MKDFNLSRPALAVIDMQRYFLDEDADAYLGAPRALVANVTGLIRAFRDSRRPIVFTRHAHRKGDDAGQMGKWWGGKLPREGDRYSELIDDVRPEEGELVLTKTRYSAFEGTELDAWLLERGVDTLVICGVMTNLCVETTARHAFMKELQPLVVEDACASNSTKFHRASITNLEYGFAYIEETSSVIEVIRGGR